MKKSLFEKNYTINRPDLPLSAKDIMTSLSEKQFGILLQHALCLACLQGNAFPMAIEQYCLDAYVNLWQNSHVGDGYDLPNLYPMTAVKYYTEKVLKEALLREEK